MSLVSAVLDFATDALPVLLKRIVALNQRLQFEALRGVSHLLAAKQVDAAVHVFARDRGLDLFDAHEVLFVERAQPLEPCFQLLEGDIELCGVHGSARQWFDE
jgi:hypothetical protein